MSNPRTTNLLAIVLIAFAFWGIGEWRGYSAGIDSSENNIIQMAKYAKSTCGADYGSFRVCSKEHCEAIYLNCSAVNYP